MGEGRRRADRADQYRSREFKEWKARVAANVRRLRGLRGWTQEQAAEACGMDNRHLQAVEAGTVNLTLTTLARLTRGFSADPVELVVPAPRARKRKPGRPRKP